MKRRYPFMVFILAVLPLIPWIYFCSKLHNPILALLASAFGGLLIFGFGKCIAEILSFRDGCNCEVSFDGNYWDKKW